MIDDSVLYNNIQSFLGENDFYEANDVTPYGQDIFDIDYMMNMLADKSDIWFYKYHEGIEGDYMIYVHRLTYDSQMHTIRYEQYWADQDDPIVIALVQAANNDYVGNIVDMLNDGYIEWEDGPEHKRRLPDSVVYII